jgi:hypothetical protein
MGRSHDNAVELARTIEIIGVTPATTQQSRILPAWNALSNAEFAHAASLHGLIERTGDTRAGGSPCKCVRHPKCDACHKSDILDPAIFVRPVSSSITSTITTDSRGSLLSKPQQKPGSDPVLEQFGKTVGVTQVLENDILQFLSSKHTKNATITVQEVMNYYSCPEDRARRVLKSLVDEDIVVSVGNGTFKVNI